VSNQTLELNVLFLLMTRTAFLDIFHSMHTDKHGSPELNFRLRLLRFTVMFTKRTAPGETLPSASTLQMLRRKRREQANAFRSGDETLARLDLPDLTTHLAPLDPIKIKQEQMFPDETPKLLNFQSAHESTPPPISLLDTLPLFMALSASQNAMQETTVTQMWMQLAAGYMAQAVIEQYLVYGSRRPDVIQESFAWGFDAECRAEEGSEEWQVNAMFWNEDGAVPGWDPIRDEHIHAVRTDDISQCAATNRLCNSAFSSGRRRSARTSTNADRQRSLNRQIRGACLGILSQGAPRSAKTMAGANRVGENRRPVAASGTSTAWSNRNGVGSNR